jgi:DNA-binding response OmpR family regulator
MECVQHKSILIAEDESDIGLLLMYHLQRQDFRTYTAADGRSALKMAFDLKPDLLLLDLMLPNLHGWEVCRLIRQAPATQHIPIVIYTALDTLENRNRSHRWGVSEYFSKKEPLSVVFTKIRLLLSLPSAG